MLPKLISKNGGPLTLSENPDYTGPQPGAWVHRVASWEEGSISLQYDYPEKETGILFIQLKVLREDRIQLLTSSSPISLIFVFGENCRLTIQGSSLILHDRGGAGFSGTLDRYLCEFQKEVSYVFILIQYPVSFFETELFIPWTTPGFFYLRPVVSDRETLDDLSALIFSNEPKNMGDFIRGEICRSLFVRFTDPYMPRLFQPAGFSLSDHAVFYRLRGQLLKEVTRILEYPELMASAGIRDTYYFRKACKQLYGLNPTQYITEARMAHAVTMLKDHTLSIKEIALNSGFPSTQYFDRVFVNYFGVTPKTFRQR